MVTIDAHIHLGHRAGADYSAGDIVAQLDATGVDKAVVFTFPEGTFDNSAILPAVEKYPDRLLPFCVVNPWDEERAQNELRDCLANRGFLGLKLHPTLGGYRLSEPGICWPLFEILEEFGRPVIVHGLGELLNCPLEFARMAARFPKVNLIMAHSGYFWGARQAVEVAMEHKNLYLEVSRIPLFEVRRIITNVDIRQVIWGTDAPFAEHKFEFDKMSLLGLSEEDYGLVMGGNIRRLLGI